MPGVRARLILGIYSGPDGPASVAARNMGFQPGPQANIAEFENTDTTGKTFEMGIVPTSGRHQTESDEQ